jgi:hypothetical protein
VPKAQAERDLITYVALYGAVPSQDFLKDRLGSQGLDCPAPRGQAEGHDGGSFANCDGVRTHQSQCMVPRSIRRPVFFTLAAPSEPTLAVACWSVFSVDPRLLEIVRLS